MSFQAAIDEIKAIREQDEKQHFLEEELKRLREQFVGAEVIQVRYHYSEDFELVLNNAMVVRFDQNLVRRL